MTDTNRITSAGRLLDQSRKLLVKNQSSGHSLAETIKKDFSISAGIPWQVGILRFSQLVARTKADLDILSEERRIRYTQTLDHIDAFVSPNIYGQNTGSTVKAHFNDLTLERLENLHENLMISGRYFSIDEEQVRLILVATDTLREEFGQSENDVCRFAVSQLDDLIAAINRYELFGPEGVQNLVEQLIGSAMTKSYEKITPLDSANKSSLSKIFSISKLILDGVVYVSAGAEAITWAGDKVAALLK